MLKCIDRVLPCQVVAIRLGNHIGIATATGIHNQCLVNAINLIVLLRCSKLAGHLLKHSIALGILSKRIVIYSFIIEKIVLKCIIGSIGNLVLHNFYLILGAITLAQLDIHSQTLLGDNIVEGSLLLGILATCFYLLIGTTKQVEGFFPIIFLVIHGCTACSTFHTRLKVTLLGIVFESTDKMESGTCHISFFQIAFSTLV